MLFRSLSLPICLSICSRDNAGENIELMNNFDGNLFPFGTKKTKKDKVPQKENNFSNNLNSNSKPNQSMNTTPRAYDIPNNDLKNDLNNYNYSVSNIKKNAESRWNEISKDLTENQNKIQQNNNLSLLSSTSLINSGGSYRGISSPSVGGLSSISKYTSSPSTLILNSKNNNNIYNNNNYSNNNIYNNTNNNNNNNNNLYLNSYSTPYGKDISNIKQTNFKVYNVSPIMDPYSSGVKNKKKI